MIEIEADFGTTVRGGMIRAYRSDAPASLEIGEVVRAVDHDEDLSYVGTVYEIDGPFIYLLMHWGDAGEVVPMLGGGWVGWVSAGAETGTTGGTGLSIAAQTVQVGFPVAV